MPNSSDNPSAIIPIQPEIMIRNKPKSFASEIEDLLFRDFSICQKQGTSSSNTLKKYCRVCKRYFPLHFETCARCNNPLELPTPGDEGIQRERREYLDTVIAGKYRVIEELGKGGFGSVYLVKHEYLPKRFAIKVLRSKFSRGTEHRNRFHEEALKLSRLENDHIIKVFDFGESEDCQYMVTEYVQGADLGHIIYSGNNYSKKAPPLRAAKIMRQIAAALAEAHSKKIIHLDLKPQNILVLQKHGMDVVKVIDFGIAEIYSQSTSNCQKVVTGTSTYMAPEQWQHKTLDPRTDIYSFGAIFYEFLAGRPPFPGSDVKEIKKYHCNSPPTPLSRLRAEVPPELERLIHRCLEKRPERRVQSAGELEDAISIYIRRSKNWLRRWLPQRVRLHFFGSAD